MKCSLCENTLRLITNLDYGVCPHCGQYQIIPHQNIKKIPVEVFSRVVGYFRPVDQWNPGKQEEFFMRKNMTSQGVANACR